MQEKTPNRLVNRMSDAGPWAGTRVSGHVLGSIGAGIQAMR